jgi:CRP-like cAMP-binding protein
MSEVTDKIDAYLKQYPSRTYSSGETVLFAHQQPTDIFYIVSGKVNMYDVSPKGNEVVVNVYEPGRFFPLSWAINSTPNHYFFRTEADSVFRVIPPKDIVDFILKNADVGFELLQRIYQKTDRLFERTVYLTSSTASRRLTYELIIECRRFGKRQADGSYTVAVREMDMASRSGLSRETVSREFQKLKESGYVRLEKQGIRILNFIKLQESIGVLP